MPSQIATETEEALPNISRALRNLTDRGMAELLVPESRQKGRVYGITLTGEEIWRQIDAEGLA